MNVIGIRRILYHEVDDSLFIEMERSSSYEGIT